MLTMVSRVLQIIGLDREGDIMRHAHVKVLFPGLILAFLGLHAIRETGAAQVDFVPGEVLVKVRAVRQGASVASLSGSSFGGLVSQYAQGVDPLVKAKPASAMRSAAAQDAEQVLQRSGLERIQCVRLKPGLSVEEAVAAFQASTDVEYAEPNYLATAHVTPNDPYFHTSGSWKQVYDDLWGLKKILAPPAWDVSQGEGVVVAVIDTGIDYTHPDLADNVWVNTGEIPGNGVDDDKNNYVDDVRGWDFVYNDADPSDAFGHGTHVAGSIAAVGQNGIGVPGVAPRARVMAVKGLGDSGSGGSAGLAAGVIYAVDNGARVLNNSWGGPSSKVIADAFDYAHAHGALSLASAGNSNAEVRGVPAGLAHVMAVAASTQKDEKASFSNFGMKIDVAAPGGGYPDDLESGDGQSNILSTMPDGSAIARFSPGLKVSDGYYRLAGTSMACPHAAGVAALVFAHRPGFTHDEVRQVLRVSADDVADAGFDFQTGFGRVNAKRALEVEHVLKVAITSPASGGVLDQRSETVAILGRAAGPGFQSYQLFFARESNLQTWTEVGPPVLTPIEDGRLASWDIAGLETDRYFLRLVATGAGGLQFEDLVPVVLESVTQLTTDPRHQAYAAIWEHRVVYADDRHGDYNIYLFDLDTKQEQRISTSSSHELNPDVYGERIVWRQGGFNTWNVYVHDLATGVTSPVTSSGSVGFKPSIWGDRVVYTDRRAGARRPDVYVYDLAAGAERRLTATDAYKTEPSVWENRVAWFENRAGGFTYDLFVYDLGTGVETRIPIGHGFPSLQQIWQDRIVWTAFEDGYNIFLYDLAAASQRRITSDEASPSTYIDISGNTIVWHDNRRGFGDIYAYDLRRDRERRVTAHPTGQYQPAIWGARVVWEDQRNDGLPGGSPVFVDSDIYLSELGRPPELSPIGRRTVKEGEFLSFTIEASDPDGDPLTYLASNLPPGASFDARERTFSWTPGPDQAGAYSVTFSVTDADFTVSETVLIEVEPVNDPPSSVSVAPASGSARYSRLVTFTATYSDRDGWRDVAQAHFLMSRTLSSAQAMRVRYDENQNRFYLMNDSGTGWCGSCTPGSSVVLSNSQGRMHCASSRVSGSGDTLTVSLRLNFRARFRGRKNVYLSAQDDAGAASEFCQRGTWTVL